MKYLVTGGAGFIGSWLCDLLCAKGHECIVVDDFSTGNMENIKHLTDYPKFDCFKADVADRSVMVNLVYNCDAVFHLAATVGVMKVMSDPARAIENNIKGTEVVLELCSVFKKKILLASTSEVYGKSNDVPFREEAGIVLGNTDNARWSYACSKAIDEFLAMDYHKSKGLDIIVARLFNTVGPRQVSDYGMVIPSFVEAALKGEDIVIYGTGEQIRCFCHVYDVVEALHSLMYSEGQYDYPVFNVGSREETSILGLAKEIKERTNSLSEIKYCKPTFDDMFIRVPDIQKIHNAIGWEAQRTLNYILSDVIVETEKKIKPELAGNRPAPQN